MRLARCDRGNEERIAEIKRRLLIVKHIIRATTNPEITERENNNMVLARKIGAEGMVLLENDGSLPVHINAGNSSRKVALYGFGARHTGFGGTGSGENHPRVKVNIEEGLIAAGLMISSTAWLDDFDREYASEHQKWKDNLTEEMKNVPRMKQMDYASARPFQPPFGRPITEEDVRKSDTDTAVYVLTRQAGEGADRKEEEGDWYIRSEEKEHLQFLSAHYAHVILILNIGGLIDLGFLDEIHIGAVLYAMQGGMEMGNSVADILTGKVNPSGRLTDTWAMKYEDYPCWDTYSYRSGDSHIEEYREGIYVGYRWFDAKGIRPRYPFGYGLGYTDFKVSVKSTRFVGGIFSTDFMVRNVGHQTEAFLSGTRAADTKMTDDSRAAGYPGKEVVQVYLSAPQGRLSKEVKSLAGFVKTTELRPGESTMVTVSFALRDFASFDEENSCFILEKGDYLVQYGTVSDQLTPAACLHLEEDIVTEEVEHICPVKDAFEKETIPALPSPAIPAGLVTFEVRNEDIPTQRHTYKAPATAHNDRLDRAMKKVKKKDLMKFLVGTSYFGSVQNIVFGAGGRSWSGYAGKGIPDMPMSDGPQGLNLLPRNLKPKQYFVTMPALPETLNFGRVRAFSSLTEAKENDTRKIYYQYCTAWPCETIVAQTWDRDLEERQGDAVAKEMEELGVVFWLAPAMNIHRNPLCGRNYEYYSEDPLVSGETAAAVTKGVQAHEGCYVTLKHFCCNNLECDRNMSDSRIDERPLREIYLRGFRIAVEKAQAKGIMASYNLVNGTYVANNYDLLTRVLRNEWGFDGLVMTDWFATGHDDAKDELCVSAGCDMIMPGVPPVNRRLKKALEEGIITEEQIEHNARNVINAAVHACVNRR